MCLRILILETEVARRLQYSDDESGLSDSDPDLSSDDDACLSKKKSRVPA